MRKETIQQAAAASQAELRDIRRHLHQYPEYSFKEYKTQAFVAEKLGEWGIESSKIGETGLIATIDSGNPGPTIGLRGDMDALPIQEENTHDYASKVPGMMHACGHDVHTTCLLGAAKLLQEHRSTWKGKVKLLFQPGEEQSPGGASILIKEGALKNPAPEVLFGQHVEPYLEAGKIGFRAGPFMASADELHITVAGKGGHAAFPQRCIDPVLISAHLIVALQQLVSRHSDPLTPSVLSIGKINSDGGATNIIPERVFLKGTFRTFDEEWRELAKQRMKNLAETLCASMGGSCEFNIITGYPFLNNDAAAVDRFKKFATEYVGEEQVVELPMRMSSEDFSFYSQHIPTCFYRLGTKPPAQQKVHGLHTPLFDVDESVLSLGAGLMAWVGMREASEQIVASV